MANDYSKYSMWDLFRMEVQLHNGKISSSLIQLEAGKVDPALFQSLMRAAHSLKGAARVVELQAISELAHAFENIFKLLQTGIQLNTEQTSFLLSVCDYFENLQDASDAQLQQHFMRPDTAAVELQKQLMALENLLKNSGPIVDENPAKITLAQLESSEPQNAGENFIRVSAEQMQQVSALAGEIEVSIGWTDRLTEAMFLLKREQYKLSQMIHRLRDSFEDQELGQYSSSLLDEIRSYSLHTHQLTVERISDIDQFGRRVHKLSNDLNRKVMQSRMRPFSEGVHGLPRLVRDLGVELGKTIKFIVEGADTPVDRDILRSLESPLVHLVRNACDHGIESSAQRRQAGKPEQAIITLRASHSSGQLSVVVEDDGSGVDIERIRQKIVDKGFVEADTAQQMSEQAVMEYLFASGFSSAESVSQISGRGVGLDVVRHTVQAVGGLVRITSDKGSGTRIILQLPLSYSVAHVLLLDIGGFYYAIQTAHIHRVLRIDAKRLTLIEGRQHIQIENDYIPVIASSDILQGTRPLKLAGTMSLLIIGDVRGKYALVVDGFLEDTKLVIQSVDQRMGKVTGISACAVSREGEPVLILDVEDCVRVARKIVEKKEYFQSRFSIKTRSRHILFVDDSVAMRELVRRQLQALGFHVDTAIDGQQAYQKMQNENYELLLTDIQMPNMDGFQLISQVRSNNNFENIPIIILTTLTDEKSRKRGFDVGADFFISKSAVSEAQVHNAISDLIGLPETNLQE